MNDFSPRNAERASVRRAGAAMLILGMWLARSAAPQAAPSAPMSAAASAFVLAQTAPAEGAGTTSEIPAGIESPPLDGFEPETPRPIGNGDEHIWVIPSISAPSVKNGGKISFSAVVRAAAGVEKIEATIREAEGDAPKTIDTLALTPSDSKFGGVSMDGKLGLWSAEWTGKNLEEKPYRVTLKVTDRAGRVFADESLTFTDPAVGVFAPGTTAYPNSGMRRIGAGGEDIADMGCAVIDSAAGYAYFASQAYTWVEKVSIQGAGAPTSAGLLTLPPDENFISCAVIDTAAGYAYFGLDDLAAVVKVALGGAGPPTRVGRLILYYDVPGLKSAVIDTAAGCAYFGTTGSPGSVVKVALGVGAALPTLVGILTLNAGEDELKSAVIDPAAGYAYFGTNTSPGLVVKVALGPGAASPPSRVGALTLAPGESYLESAVIDTAAGHAYFGTGTSPGMVIKVALGAGAAPPTRVGALTLNAGENGLASAVIDPASGYAYFGTDTIPGIVVKAALGAGAAPPTRVGALTLNAGDNYLESAVIDPAAGRAYFGINGFPAPVIKVGLSQNGQIKSNAFTMPELGVVNDVNFYSHAAKGNARLAIYDDATPRNKLWESGSVTNGVAGGFLSIPIYAGTPSSLTLPAGHYQLAWQVDALADVPSYALDTDSEGLSLNWPYGAFPPDLDSLAPTSTTERWTMYLTYAIPSQSPTPSLTPAATPSPTPLSSAAADWSAYE